MNSILQIRLENALVVADDFKNKENGNVKYIFDTYDPFFKNPNDFACILIFDYKDTNIEKTLFLHGYTHQLNYQINTRHVKTLEKDIDNFMFYTFTKFTSVEDGKVTTTDLLSSKLIEQFSNVYANLEAVNTRIRFLKSSFASLERDWRGLIPASAFLKQLANTARFFYVKHHIEKNQLDSYFNDASALSMLHWLSGMVKPVVGSIIRAEVEQYQSNKYAMASNSAMNACIDYDWSSVS